MDLPTPTTYKELQQAYDFLNKKLFSNELPPCLITLQRERNTSGYFSGRRFTNKDGQQTDEIALNPTYFAVQPVKIILSTLAHEMAHLWQCHFGKAGRGRYHNKQWAKKMIEIGLIPSDTGQPGGKQTGDRMADYIETAGIFDQVCDDLLTREFQISWFDRFIPTTVTNTPSETSGDQTASNEVRTEELPFTPDELNDLNFETSDTRTTKSNRVKYRCSGDCASQVWGKPKLSILCGTCDGATFEPVIE